MSAKFIDFLRSWGESLFTSKRAYISNQAMPGDTDVIVSANPSSTNPVRFVAPSDGYVYVSDRGVNNQVSSLEVNHADYGPFGTRSFGDGNSIIRLIFPVKKGRSVDINFSNMALTDIVCRFRATIGGGLNQIIQAIGGGLCHLSHSLNRFSSSLVAKQCRVLLALLKTQSLQTRQLSLHSTDTQRSDLNQRLTTQFATQESSQTISIQLFTPRVRTQQTVCNTRWFTCLCAKVQTLAQSLLVSHQARFASLRQSAQANLALEGGAL